MRKTVFTKLVVFFFILPAVFSFAGQQVKSDLPAPGRNKVAYYAFDATPKNQGVYPLTTFTDKANIVVVFEGTLWELADSAHYNTGWMQNKYYKYFRQVLDDIQVLRKRGIKVLMNLDDTKAWSTATPFITHDGRRLDYKQYAAFVDSCLTLVGFDGVSLDIEHGATDNSNYRELITELGKYMGPLSGENSTKRIYTAAIYKSSYGVPGPTVIGYDRNVAKYFNFVMDMGYFQDNAARFKRWADSLGNDKVMIGFSHDDANNSLPVAVNHAKWHPTPDKAGVMVFAGNVNKVYTDSIFAALDASFPNDVNNGSEITGVPQDFVLSQNYPNPFNPETKINYALPEAGYCVIKVYDVLGKEVSTLVDEFKNAGHYSVMFNSANKNLTSGVYFYKMTINNYSQIKKMILMK